MTVDVEEFRRAKRTETLQVMLNDREIRAIETFRIEQGISSRSAALRVLMGHGLGCSGPGAGTGRDGARLFTPD